MTVMTKLRALFDLIEYLVESQFTGKLVINFTQGGIAKVEKTEVIK